MYFKPIPLLVFLALTLLPFLTAAQNAPTPKSPARTAIDSMMLQSSVIGFRQLSVVSPDTAKAVLRVRVMEKGGGAEPIQGATVLLRRDNDKMLGRVTKHDGRCLFAAVPASYTVRVQMTGLKSLEKSGLKLEAGKMYDLEIMMAQN